VLKFSVVFLRKSTATLLDSLFQFGWSEEKVFYSYFDVTNSFTQTEATDIELLRLWVMQDTSEDLYERRVYSIMDLIGQLGGFFEMFLIIGGFFINSFREKAYLYSVFNKLYIMKNDESDRRTKVKVNGSNISPNMSVLSQNNKKDVFESSLKNTKPWSKKKILPSPQTPINTPHDSIEKDEYF